jgi:hypothetical protein
MAKPFRARLLEVTVTAQEPTLWKWDISEHGREVMYGYETSRETAQIEGDSALFRLFSEGQRQSCDQPRAEPDNRISEIAPNRTGWKWIAAQPGFRTFRLSCLAR